MVRGNASPRGPRPPSVSGAPTTQCASPLRVGESLDSPDSIMDLSPGEFQENLCGKSPAALTEPALDVKEPVMQESIASVLGSVIGVSNEQLAAGIVALLSITAAVACTMAPAAQSFCRSVTGASCLLPYVGVAVGITAGLIVGCVVLVPLAIVAETKRQRAHSLQELQSRWVGVGVDVLARLLKSNSWNCEQASAAVAKQVLEGSYGTIVDVELFKPTQSTKLGICFEKVEDPDRLVQVSLCHGLALGTIRVSDHICSVNGTAVRGCEMARTMLGDSVGAIRMQVHRKLV